MTKFEHYPQKAVKDALAEKSKKTAESAKEKAETSRLTNLVARETEGKKLKKKIEETLSKVPNLKDKLQGARDKYGM